MRFLVRYNCNDGKHIIVFYHTFKSLVKDTPYHNYGKHHKGIKSKDVLPFVVSGYDYNQMKQSARYVIETAYGWLTESPIDISNMVIVYSEIQLLASKFGLLRELRKLEAQLGGTE